MIGGFNLDYIGISLDSNCRYASVLYFNISPFLFFGFSFVGAVAKVVGILIEKSDELSLIWI